MIDLKQLPEDDQGYVASATEELADALKHVVDNWLSTLEEPEHPANLIIPAMSLAAIVGYVLWLAEQRSQEEGSRPDFATELREVFDKEVSRFLALLHTEQSTALH